MPCVLSGTCPKQLSICNHPSRFALLEMRQPESYEERRQDLLDGDDIALPPTDSLLVDVVYVADEDGNELPGFTVVHRAIDRMLQHKSPWSTFPLPTEDNQ